MARQGLPSARGLCLALMALFIFATANPATADARYAARTLAVGSHGSDVKKLQTYLARVGIATTADGEYGRGTARSVKSFERQKGLRADGRATPSDQRLVKRTAKQAATRTPANGTGADETGTGGSAYDEDSDTEPTPT